MTNFWGLLIGANLVLFYAAIAQLMLTIKYRKRAIWAAVTTLSFVIVPVVCFGFGDIQPRYNPVVWLFSFMPLAGTTQATSVLPITTIMMSILGQWLTIAVTGFYLSRKLKQAGISESKMLFSQKS